MPVDAVHFSETVPAPWAVTLRLVGVDGAGLGVAHAVFDCADWLPA